MVIAGSLAGSPADKQPGSSEPTSPVSDRLAPLAQGDEGSSRFHFTRAVYSDVLRQGRSWFVDFPEADRHFLIGLERLTAIDPFERENPVRLDDPALRNFPFLYAVEVGYMALTEPEVEGLRGYLLAGGFLVVDDFWGSREWANFEFQIKRVLPEFAITELPIDHPLMSSFYEIEEVRQVPGFGRGVRGFPTWERDGYVPHLRGIFDDDGRLVVLINWNTDLGDAWEHADMAEYPLNYSTYAYRLGINTIIYALTH